MTLPTNKGVTLITEMAEKDVTFLTDLDPLYVSLVKHAANQQPFRIVKTDKTKGEPAHTTDTKKKGEDMGMLVHSILIPNTVPIEALLATKELAWLGDANLTEKQEFEKYARFEQIPVNKFEKASLKLTKVHDTGVWVVEGQLTKGTQVEKALSIGESQSPMWQPVAEETTVYSYTTTFGDIFYNELDRFASITSGLISQVAADPVARKAAIMTALEAFTSFLSMSLDAVSNSAIKMDRTNPNKTEGGQEMFTFETKEEFVTAVSEVVKTAITEKEAVDMAANAAADKEAATKEAARKSAGIATTQESSEQFKALEGTLAEMGKQIKELAEKTEKIGGSLLTPPSTKTMVEERTPTPEKKQSLFAGILG